MSKPPKTPNVAILEPFNPSPESVRRGTLEYGKLGSEALRHAQFDTQRQNEFFDTELGSLEEEQKGRQWAMQYLLMTAARLSEVQTEESKELWSGRFTQATRELYGEPEQEIARQLATVSADQLLRQAKTQQADPQLIAVFEEKAQSYGMLDPELVGEAKDFSEIARKAGDYFRTRYEDVYKATGFENGGDTVTPAEFSDGIERAFVALAENHDQSWGAWQVDRNAERSVLSMAPAKKTAIVGMLRAAMTPAEAKGLFTHEILIHGLRGLNGDKLSPELKKGLPGYLDFEEGLGIFAEYAVTGVLPEKSIDRYVDISLALGEIDGVQKTRQELLDFVTARSELRSSLKAPIDTQSEDDRVKGVYTHVNRIYRGGLGNEHIGIFTKDIAYQKGFIDAASFIAEMVERGIGLSDVMDYLLQGKFTPLDDRHIEHIKEINHG